MKDETVLGLSTGDKIILIIVPPILGALLGWFIPTIAGWAIKIPIIPFDGLLEWIAALESRWVSVIAACIGVLAGVFFIFYAFSETLKITITDHDVKLDFREKSHHIHKKEISAIYMEGKELVFLNADGKERYRGKPESKKTLVSEAFNQQGYPWKDTDPYEEQYQRWVADDSSLPPHVHALLSARERALKKDKTEEAQVLRRDLADLGVVIRDEDKRQYIRIARGAAQ